jgi:hypothetical protein
MMAPTVELRAALADAIEEVTLAETALDSAVRQLTVGAEKVGVSDVVANALARVRAARVRLTRLRLPDEA